MAYTDNFSGSNGDTLPTYSGNWSNIGDSDMEIQSNQASPSAGGACSDMYNAGTFAAAHYAQAKIVSGDYVGPAIRMASTSNFFYCFASTASNSFPGESIAGSLTDWDSGQATLNANDVARLEADPVTPTTIYYKVNVSTIQTYTGKNALSGGKAGVAAYGSGSGVLDDWEAGDVAVASASLLVNDRQRRFQNLIVR